jgi:hypothetical protein
MRTSVGLVMLLCYGLLGVLEWSRKPGHEQRRTVNIFDSLEADPREEKLPVWARETLKRLRRDVVDARNERDTARLATNPDTSTALLWPNSEHERIGLDKTYASGETSAANVRFRLDMSLNLRQSERMGAYIDCRAEGNELVVHGGSSLIVRPWVTNVVRISASRD